MSGGGVQKVPKARQDGTELAEKVNPRLYADVSWDFIGKFASGVGEGIAVRATGTPTGVAQLSGTNSGEITATLAATDEVEFSGIDWGDILQVQATGLPYFTARVKTPAGTVAATQDVVIGLASAYNATLNSTTQYLRFRLQGSNVLKIEGTDGVTPLNAQATGVTLGLSEYNWFTIEERLADKKYCFYVNETLVGTLSFQAFAATDFLQPSIGIRKASGVTVPVLTIDHLRCKWNR